MYHVILWKIHEKNQALFEKALIFLLVYHTSESTVAVDHIMLVLATRGCR